MKAIARTVTKLSAAPQQSDCYCEPLISELKDMNMEKNKKAENTPPVVSANRIKSIDVNHDKVRSAYISYERSTL